jgi:hypothetical protein
MSVRPVLFVNFTDRPFSGVPYQWPAGSEEMSVDEHCKWDGVPDTFAPHASRYMEEWRANHYAKHLINRELDKMGKQINDVKLRGELLAKCIINKGESVENSNIEMELMNKNIKAAEVPNVSSELPKKKLGRPAKTKVEEPEFADLNNAK